MEGGDRREFLKKVGLASAGLAFAGKILGRDNDFAKVPEDNLFVLPALRYAYDGLEPFIDKQTMELHHSKHHQAYVDKLNKALQEAKVSGVSLEDICRNVSKYSPAVRNNGGGHYNHSLFWQIMTPNKGTVLSPASASKPIGKLGEAIKTSFGSFSDFKIRFSETALKVFGSGWAWTVINKDGKLEIGSTLNQDNPLMDISEFKGTPILALDVWEHAYYLKYQNLRKDYIANWWNVVNWQEVAARLGDDK